MNIFKKISSGTVSTPAKDVIYIAETKFYKNGALIFEGETI